MTQARALRFCQLPERQSGRAERLSANDLRGRARAGADRLGFVLHLGDFIYEIVWYPGRPAAGNVRPAPARHCPLSARREESTIFTFQPPLMTIVPIYRAYLHDPDLQDARARWPFVNMWDNHEFSWLGWQGLQKFDGVDPARADAQSGRQPGILRIPAGADGEARVDPRSINSIRRRWSMRPITSFDDHGLGQEPNNLTAIHSLKGYRALRWGRNVDLIVTDQRSYRSEDPTDRAEAKAFSSEDFPELIPQEAMEILDAGRAYNGGHPPQSIRYGGLGSSELSAKTSRRRPSWAPSRKPGFSSVLRASQATWKIWGNTTAHSRHARRPAESARRPDQALARCRIRRLRRRRSQQRVCRTRRDLRFRPRPRASPASPPSPATAIVSGRAWPQSLSHRRRFEPVGIAFVTGSISARGMVEALEHSFPKDHPLRPLYLGQGPADTKPQPTVNMLLRHGVRSCLEYAKSGDIERARAAHQPGSVPAPFVRRYGRPRLCRCPRHQRKL